jgi:ZIP family zinc transporter
MKNEKTENSFSWKILLSALVPLILLGGLVFWLLGNGSTLFNTPDLPADEITAANIKFSENEVHVKVRNTGANDVTIATVLVNGAIMHNYEISPDNTLDRLETATIKIPLMWEEGKPYVIGLYTKNAFIFDFEVPAAIPAPTISWDSMKTFILMGTFVGIIPVILGFFWLPVLRRIGEKSISALVALTVGVLAFLGVDTILEGLELAETVPAVFNGVALFVMAVALGYFGIVGIEAIVKRSTGRFSKGGLLLPYMIALGIGVHNLGEGLAIGSAFILGEVALGTLLIVGFAIHNVTEGIAILAPGVNKKINFGHLVGLGLVAGAPTILGGMIGGYSYSPVLATIFFGIAAGAILQVIRECWGLVKGKDLEDKIQAIPNWIGLSVGFILMYVTALFVAG